MEHRFTSAPIPLCAAATKSRAAARWRSTPSISVWISNCAAARHAHQPLARPVEVNVPFDGDVEYLINNEVVRIEKGYITLFWACTPHQLTRPGDCQQMAIFNLPMHLFLSWPLDRELINHVTHGMVIKSLAAQQLSAFEVRRWQQELSHENEQIRQLAIDEIALMLKRLSLAGWQPILVNKTSRTHKNSVSRHAQFYVSQMLEFIAAHYDRR